MSRHKQQYCNSLHAHNNKLACEFMLLTCLQQPVDNEPDAQKCSIAHANQVQKMQALQMR